MSNHHFHGAVRVGASFLDSFENHLTALVIPRLPYFIETYHLTLMTIPISAGIIGTAYLTHLSIHWLWLSSFLIIFQWLTDLFDGSLGRWRNTGLERWGYYMDHFVDYIFLASLIIGYALIFPHANQLYFILILATLSAFMFNSSLAFGATQKFRVVFFGIGPTEIRLVFIIINIAIIFFQPASINNILPWIFSILLFSLIILIYCIQKQIWQLDKKNITASRPQ